MHYPPYTIEASLYSKSRILELQGVVTQQELNALCSEVFVVKPLKNLDTDLMVFVDQVAAEGNQLE
jgi:hypothetical protein